MIPNDAALSPDDAADPFLDVTRLTPSAPVTLAEAAAAVRASFGLTGELDRLPGEADDNFLLRSTAGPRYVVKFAHLRADPEVISVQVRVLRHIESAAAALPVPRVFPAVGGQPWTVVAEGPLRGRVVHVISYLDGQLLRSVPTSAALRRRLGATLATLGQALRDFDDPLVRRPLLWDLAQLPRLRPLLAELPSGPGASRLDEQLSRFTAEVAPRLATQRRQLVHNDFSPDNVLVDADASHVAGIIDFGDVTVTALVSDVAIAAAYQLSAGPDLLGPALNLISGYHAITPLAGHELDLLAELMLARILARIVISEWRAARFPDNRAYILRNTPKAWEHLSRLLAIGGPEITARIHRACRPEAGNA
jgi:Ser/Thr protein kinase RdoA (MazF antagonist)